MCIEWMNKQIKKMTWQDIALTKVAMLVLGVLLAKIWPATMSYSWYVYVIIIVICAIPVYMTVFSKN